MTSSTRKPTPETIARIRAQLAAQEPHRFVMIAGPPHVPAGHTEIIRIDPKRGAK